MTIRVDGDNNLRDLLVDGDPSRSKEAPTPWQPHGRSDIDDANGIVVATFYGEVPQVGERRHLVVRAVNAHDALVEICKITTGLLETTAICRANGGPLLASPPPKDWKTHSTPLEKLVLKKIEAALELAGETAPKQRQGNDGESQKTTQKCDSSPAK